MFPAQAPARVWNESHPGPSTQSSDSLQPAIKRKRASKACEPCREKRRKCAGGQPCPACLEDGIREGCVYRAKARPNRPLRKTSTSAPIAWYDSEPHHSAEAGRRAIGDVDRGQFIRRLEERLERFAAGRGLTLNLSLPSTSFLSPLLTGGLPPLRASHAQQLSSLETFLSTQIPLAHNLAPTLCQNLLKRFHEDPATLPPDRLALLFGCLCLGRMRVLGQGYGTVRFIPMQGGGEDEVGYFRRALEGVKAWGSASPTAMTALLLLRNFAFALCGPIEVRDVLGLLAWQCKELGIHRLQGLRAGTDQEQMRRLFWLTFYQEGQFSTLASLPPFFRSGEYDATCIPQLDPNHATSEIDRGIEPFPFLVALTILEHDISTAAHDNGPFDVDELLAYEGRLAEWHRAFVHDKERRGEGVALHTFAHIRYHWLRIMLRLPVIDQPTLAYSSLAILARAAPQILSIYSTISSSKRFATTWGETRRITTAAHVVWLCYVMGELERDETEALVVVSLDLLWKLADGCMAAGTAVDGVQKMFGLLGLTPRAQPTGEVPVGETGTPVQAQIAPPLVMPELSADGDLATILGAANEPFLWPDEFFFGDLPLLDS